MSTPVHPDTTGFAGNTLSAVEFNLAQTLPLNSVAHLCHAIQEAISGSEGARIVSFFSPQQNEAPGRIAFETAHVAATQLGLRVLFVDTMTMDRKPRMALVNAVKTPLSKIIAAGGAVEDSMVSIAGSRMAYMLMGKPGAGGVLLADLEIVSAALQKLRPSYDLIIVEAPSILDGPFGVALTKISDGAVMVVQAERTRAPVALQARQLVESAGGIVIGAVMDRRRYYIPRWAYHWI